MTAGWWRGHPQNTPALVFAAHLQGPARPLPTISCHLPENILPQHPALGSAPPPPWPPSLSPSAPSPWLLPSIPSSPSREPPRSAEPPTTCRRKGRSFAHQERAGLLFLPPASLFCLQGALTTPHRGQHTKATPLQTMQQWGPTTLHPSSKGPTRVCSCWTEGP